MGGMFRAPYDACMIYRRTNHVVGLKFVQADISKILLVCPGLSSKQTYFDKVLSNPPT